jgi:hypothetical protein
VTDGQARQGAPYFLVGGQLRLVRCRIVLTVFAQLDDNPAVESEPEAMRLAASSPSHLCHTKYIVGTARMHAPVVPRDRRQPPGGTG